MFLGLPDPDPFIIKSSKNSMKNLDSHCLWWLLYNFLSLKIMLMELRKVINKKPWKKNLCLLAILKEVTDENSRIRNIGTLFSNAEQFSFGSRFPSWFLYYIPPPPAHPALVKRSESPLCWAHYTTRLPLSRMSASQSRYKCALIPQLVYMQSNYICS